MLEKRFASVKLVEWIHDNYKELPMQTIEAAREFGEVHPINHKALHKALSELDTLALKAEGVL